MQFLSTETSMTAPLSFAAYLFILLSGQEVAKYAKAFSVLKPCARKTWQSVEPRNCPNPVRHVTCVGPSALSSASSKDADSSEKDSGSNDDIEDVDASPAEKSSANDDKARSVEETSSKSPTFRERLKKLWFKEEDDGLTTRQRLAKMGLAAVLSYGWVSNVSYAVCISIAWYGFSKKTKLSPLAPDQWKPFLAVYAGFFVFNNFVRPFRLGLSVAISRHFDNVISWVQDKTRFSRAISIALVVFLFNIVGTISLMTIGISLASLASGVPIFPGKA